jgi:hypothetical protein
MRKNSKLMRNVYRPTLATTASKIAVLSRTGRTIRHLAAFTPLNRTRTECWNARSKAQFFSSTSYNVDASDLSERRSEKSSYPVGFTTTISLADFVQDWEHLPRGARQMDVVVRAVMIVFTTFRWLTAQIGSSCGSHHSMERVFLKVDFL